MSADGLDRRPEELIAERLKGALMLLECAEDKLVHALPLEMFMRAKQSAVTIKADEFERDLLNLFPRPCPGCTASYLTENRTLSLSCRHLHPWLTVVKLTVQSALSRGTVNSTLRFQRTLRKQRTCCDGTDGEMR
jgi:hypothetical protein